jgi:hypothetical protein
MSSGFSGTGSFKNNRKSVSFYGIPLSNERFYSRLTLRQKAELAYVILSNGNGQSNRIRNFVKKN